MGSERERMAQLKLFCDRISHASRAPLLLLHSAKVPHEEINVKLFRGEHMKRKQLPGAGQWYGDRSVKEKVKIDEYLDFWQSSVHPTAVKVLQNKLMYKMVFRRSEPDEKVVSESLAAHES